jgi:hypothetical protein
VIRRVCARGERRGGKDKEGPSCRHRCQYKDPANLLATVGMA